MAKLVGVHGIAQQYKGPYELQHEWFVSLRDGLDAAGYTDLARSLMPDELAVSFYGRLFRPTWGDLSDGVVRGTAADIRSDPYALDLLMSIYDEVIAQQPELGPPTSGMLGATSGAKYALRKLGSYPPVQKMLERILESRTFKGSIPEALFIGNLRQVSMFMKSNDQNLWMSLGEAA